MEHFINHLQAQYDTLTPCAKKIADYLKTHRTRAQYLSISSLAAECQVAEATIFRFCKQLGFQGYNDLKLALAKASVLEHNCRASSVYSNITDNTPVSTMAQQLFQIYLSAMQETLSFVNEAVVVAAGQALTNAKKVFCFGQGGSSATAMEAWGRFLTVSSKFYYIEDAHMQIMSASLMDFEDAILYVSYSGCTKDAQDILVPARKRGAKIILITHFQDSPAAKLADCILLCGGREGPLQAGSIAAKMAMLFVIDILVNEYCRQNPESTVANRDLTLQALSVRHL